MSIFSQFDNNIMDSPYSYDYQEQYDYADDTPGHSDHLLTADYGNDAYGYEDYHPMLEQDGGLADHCNINCLLCQNDPLAHAHCYHCHPFLLGDDGRPLVHVDGYYRSDGTYVQEHYRTAPDGDLTNNFSFR